MLKRSYFVTIISLFIGLICGNHALAETINYSAMNCVSTGPNQPKPVYEMGGSVSNRSKDPMWVVCPVNVKVSDESGAIGPGILDGKVLAMDGHPIKDVACNLWASSRHETGVLDEPVPPTARTGGHTYGTYRSGIWPPVQTIQFKSITSTSEVFETYYVHCYIPEMLPDGIGISRVLGYQIHR